MKILALICLLSILLVSCTPDIVSPPPESSSPPAENSEGEQLPPDTTPPEPVEVPLSYEVIDSFVEQDSYSERRTIIIGDVVMQDEIVEVFFPIGCVTVKNTDTVSGTFTIRFSFYKWDKGTPEHLIELMRTEYNDSQTVELQPNEIGTVKYSALDIELDSEWDDWSWEFEVIPSTKTMTQ